MGGGGGGVACGLRSGGGGKPGLFMRRIQTHRLARPDPPALRGLAASGTSPNRLGEGAESRGRGEEGWTASPSPVQGPCASPHAPYILPSSDRMILRRPQGG